MGLKEALASRDEAVAERDRLTRAGDAAAAAKIAIPVVDSSATVTRLRASAADLSPNELDRGGETLRVC